MIDHAEKFASVVHAAGLERIEHPLFYSARVGIRFEIGTDFKAGAGKKERAAYIKNAAQRAADIYRALPSAPDIIRIDAASPSEAQLKKDIYDVLMAAHMMPPSQTVRYRQDDMVCASLYWKCEKYAEALITAVIEADIGGCPLLASSVFFASTESNVIYHLYDDRGLDVIAADKDTLMPLYKKFSDYILEYDRERIDAIFK